jgi:imidazolonepropionase-like amidohydrolase
MLSAPGGHGTFMLPIQSWPQDIPKLEAHLARQPDVVKLMFDELGWGTRPTIPKFSQELLETLIEYVNDRGIRTTVQASSETQARQAIFAGIDTLSHPVIQGPVSESFVRLMAAKKIPMVSTIAIGENYSRLVESPEYLDQPLYRALLEPEEIRRLKTEVRQQYQERAWTWWMDVMTPIAQKTLHRIHEAGGIVALGSDQSNGAATHRELELLVEAGISPLDVIRIGTLNAATYLGLENEMGSIEEGKIADLVLLDADPITDINNAKKVNLVIKGGRIIDRSSLDLPANR